MHRRGRGRRLVGLAALALAGVPLAALVAAAAEPREAPRVSGLYETTTSEIVLIELWALDPNGDPVSDLTAEEMDLVVDSYRRPIASFEPVFSGPSGASPDGQTVAPDHRGPEAARARRFVLFFNDALSKAGGMTLARKAAIDFVSKGSVAGDQFAIAASEEFRRFRVLRFTDDRDAVVEALRRGLEDPTRVSSLVLEMERPPIDEGEAHRIRSPLSGSPLDDFRSQVMASGRSSFRGLEALVAMLAPFRGPKAIVYFGDGIMGMTNIDIEAVTRAAAAAQVTIHTANTAGLVAGDAGVVAAASRANSNLMTFADETGGLRVQSNDPSLLFRKMEAAAGGAYVLSFVPEGAADGRNHSIRLGCRRKGVTLRYRHVFVRETPAQARERRLQAAFLAPGMYPGFGLDAMAPLRAGGRDLLLYVPADRLLFLPSGTGSTAQIEIGAVALDGDGREVARLARHLEIRLSAEDALRRHAPLNLVVRGAIPPESNSVTAVVSDLNAGSLGAARLDPASESHVQGLRGLALGNADERSLWVEVPAAPPEAERGAKMAAKTTTAPPAWRASRRVAFSVSERPLCEVRLDGARPDGGKGLRLVIADQKRLALILPLEGAEVVEEPGSGVLLRAPVPLRDLEPGDFVLRVEETHDGSPVALGSMPIRIEPAGSESPAAAGKS